MANNLKLLTNQLNIVHGASDVAPHVTLSLGVACAEEPGQSMTSGDLMEAADGALYAAKRSGRNCWMLAASAPKGQAEVLPTERPSP